MRPRTTDFHGMDPWPVDAGMIECTGTAIGDVDLHNDCDILRVRVDVMPKAFTIELRHLPTGARARLRFLDADIVRIDRAEPTPDEDVLHGIDHYPDPHTGRSTFEVDLGTVLAILRATRVAFELR